MIDSHRCIKCGAELLRPENRQPCGTVSGGTEARWEGDYLIVRHPDGRTSNERRRCHACGTEWEHPVPQAREFSEAPSPRKFLVLRQDPDIFSWVFNILGLVNASSEKDALERAERSFRGTGLSVEELK